MKDQGINPDSSELYVNNTYVLLSPIANEFSQETLQSLSKLEIKCWAIGDVNYSIRKKRKKLDTCFFILVDRNGKFLEEKGRYLNLKQGRLDFNKQIETIRKSKYFVSDYVWNYKDDRHMIVLEIPKKYNDSFINFISGKYSKMFTEQQLLHLKIKDSKNSTRLSIFTRDKQFVPRFQNVLNEYYGTNVQLEDEIAEHSEIFLPFIPTREVFNYKKDYQFLIDNLFNSF